MLRPRIIPCLLISNGGLVKTVKFKSPKYVGDPINAVKIFNEKKADELIVLDIDATKKSIKPNFDLIKKLAAECRMPLCYGGGITTAEEAEMLVDIGVEKVAISSAVIENPLLLKKLVSAVGSQSVVVVLDLLEEKNFLSKKYLIQTKNGTKTHDDELFSVIKKFQDLGIGEIVLNSIDRDGMMQGYDFELVDKIKPLIKVPLTILGGAGSLEDIKKLFDRFGIIGASAGSLFVFKGKYKAVLINYPSSENKMKLYLDTID